MQVWNVLHATRWKHRTQKTRQKSPCGHHHTNLSGYIVATKACTDNRKKLINSNTSSTCPDNMVNFGPLAAEIALPVWGTPANFNGFRVLAALLQRRRSPKANLPIVTSIITDCHSVFMSQLMAYYSKQCACTNLPYFYFRSEIWRHYRVSRSQFLT